MVSRLVWLLAVACCHAAGATGLVVRDAATVLFDAVHNQRSVIRDALFSTCRNPQGYRENGSAVFDSLFEVVLVLEQRPGAEGFAWNEVTAVEQYQELYWSANSSGQQRELFFMWGPKVNQNDCHVDSWEAGRPMQYDNYWTISTSFYAFPDTTTGWVTWERYPYHTAALAHNFQNYAPDEFFRYLVLHILIVYSEDTLAARLTESACPQYSMWSPRSTDVTYPLPDVPLYSVAPELRSPYVYYTINIAQLGIGTGSCAVALLDRRGRAVGSSQSVTMALPQQYVLILPTALTGIVDCAVFQQGAVSRRAFLEAYEFTGPWAGRGED